VAISFSRSVTVSFFIWLIVTAQFKCCRTETMLGHDEIVKHCLSKSLKSCSEQSCLEVSSIIRGQSRLHRLENLLSFPFE
jgi:hypothetical protein